MARPGLYSPFRYPGGKSWLVPALKAWVADRRIRPARFIEPFCGGASASLAMIFDDMADSAIMSEVDCEVANVWSVIFHQGYWLADDILDFDFNDEMVERALNVHSNERVFRAFRTILRNRINRGGVIAPGAGVIRAGEKGRGPASRWYPQTLRDRIYRIADNTARFAFHQMDGLDLMEEHADDQGAVIFVDPPYTAGRRGAGKRLYTNHEVDHERIFAILAAGSAPFIMTYDDCREVRDLARRFGFACDTIGMWTTHNVSKRELVIARDRAELAAFVDHPVAVPVPGAGSAATTFGEARIAA